MNRAAGDLDHRLAVDSFILFLPELLAQRDASEDRRAPSAGPRMIDAHIGTCRIAGRLHPDTGKLRPARNSNDGRFLGRLQEIARANGLPEESLIADPVLRLPETEGWPAFLWFDQLISPTTFEEIFRLYLPNPTGVEPDSRKTWSELLTFWGADRGRVVAVELQTVLGSDTRRWYLVLELSNQKARVLYRGAV